MFTTFCFSLFSFIHNKNHFIHKKTDLSTCYSQAGVYKPQDIERKKEKFWQIQQYVVYKMKRTCYNISEYLGRAPVLCDPVKTIDRYISTRDPLIIRQPCKSCESARPKKMPFLLRHNLC